MICNLHIPINFLRLDTKLYKSSMVIGMLADTMRELLEIGKTNPCTNHNIHQEYGCHDHKQVEKLKIMLANAFGNPGAVMIVSVDTKLAVLAVASACVYVDVAVLAETDAAFYCRGD
jgi:hypothetical protein